LTEDPKSREQTHSVCPSPQFDLPLLTINASPTKCFLCVTQQRLVSLLCVTQRLASLTDTRCVSQTHVVWHTAASKPFVCHTAAGKPHRHTLRVTDTRCVAHSSGWQALCVAHSGWQGIPSQRAAAVAAQLQLLTL